jgi:hypothetical protein
MQWRPAQPRVAYWTCSSPATTINRPRGDAPPKADRSGIVGCRRRGVRETLARSRRRSVRSRTRRVRQSQLGPVTVSRLVNSHSGVLELAEDADRIELIGPAGLVMFEVNRIAHDALRFIVSNGIFYVREIPGELTDEEKVALASSLVECSILRVAA